ncbi:TPA: hypothetical protein ACGNAU_000531 [Streptococcus agalactiae]
MRRDDIIMPQDGRKLTARLGSQVNLEKKFLDIFELNAYFIGI